MFEQDINRVATEAEKLRSRFVTLTAQEAMAYSLEVWRSNPHNTIRTVGGIVDHVATRPTSAAPPVVE